MSKFVRLVLEIEVEITDATAAAAYTMDLSRNGDGELGMRPARSDDEQIRATVGQVVAEALSNASRSETGFKWLSQSTLLRPVVDGEHPAFTLPAMTARRDDGTFPDDAL